MYSGEARTCVNTVDVYRQQNSIFRKWTTRGNIDRCRTHVVGLRIHQGWKHSRHGAKVNDWQYSIAARQFCGKRKFVADKTMCKFLHCAVCSLIVVRPASCKITFLEYNQRGGNDDGNNGDDRITTVTTTKLTMMRAIMMVIHADGYNG